VWNLKDRMVKLQIKKENSASNITHLEWVVILRQGKEGCDEQARIFSYKRGNRRS
jgi:hypothetical protein